MFMTEVPIVWYMGHTSSALNAAVLFWPRHTKPKTKILMMTPQREVHKLHVWVFSMELVSHYLPMPSIMRWLVEFWKISAPLS